MCGIVKPNATSGEILKSNIAEITNNDTVTICAGTNDIRKNCADEGLRNIVNFVEKNSQTNIVVLEAPHRHDLAEWSCVNIEVSKFNRKLGKMLKIHNNAKVMKLSLERNNFTRHDLQVNYSGKNLYCQALANILHSPKTEVAPALPLGYTEDSQEEDGKQTRETDDSTMDLEGAPMDGLPRLRTSNRTRKPPQKLSIDFL